MLWLCAAAIIGAPAVNFTNVGASPAFSYSFRLRAPNSSQDATAWYPILMGNGADGCALGVGTPPSGRSSVTTSTAVTHVRRDAASGIALPPVQGEESARVLAEDLALRALAEPAHVLAQLLHGAGKDRVPVRIVGRPAHVVLADVIHDGRDGGLVRIARDDALPPEHRDRIVLQPGDFLRALLPVLVHAV